MLLCWTKEGREDYQYWITQDKKIIRKINTLIKDIQHSPFEGLGAPEPLKHNFSGYWSRRITKEHRLVYCLKEERLIIAQCRYHY